MLTTTAFASASSTLASALLSFIIAQVAGPNTQNNVRPPKDI